MTLDSAIGGQPMFCVFSNALDQNTNAVISGSKYCSGVIPLQGNLRWSGTVRMSGVPTTGSDIVCRYPYTSTLNTNANERNAQPYVNVNQNARRAE